MTKSNPPELPFSLQPGLPPYDEDDPKGWFALVQMIYNKYQVPSSDIPIYIQNALPPVVRSANRELIGKPWDDYTKELISRFQPDQSWAAVLETIGKMRPSENESWRVFTNKVYEIGRRADPPLPVGEICNALLKLLPKPVALAMVCFDFENISKFINTMEMVMRRQKALQANTGEEVNCDDKKVNKVAAALCGKIGSQDRFKILTEQEKVKQCENGVSGI